MPTIEPSISVVAGWVEFSASVTPQAGVDTVLTVRATLLGEEAGSVATPITAAAARRLDALLLNGEVAPRLALSQAAPGEPVVAMFRMTAFDQYGDAFAPGAVALAATATAGATLVLAQTPSADGAVTTLVATVTPFEDADTQLRLTAAVGATQASAQVDIDAVDRAAAQLRATAPTGPLAQSRPDETLSARFHLRVVDNYGADDRLPASEVRLEASADDGQTFSAPATFAIPPGGGEVEVSVTPRLGAPLFALRLVANLIGLASESAQVSIQPAAARRLARLLLDGETMRSLTLGSGAGEPAAERPLRAYGAGSIRRRVRRRRGGIFNFGHGGGERRRAANAVDFRF